MYWPSVVGGSCIFHCFERHVEIPFDLCLLLLSSLEFCTGGCAVSVRHWLCSSVFSFSTPPRRLADPLPDSPDTLAASWLEMPEFDKVGTRRTHLNMHAC